MRLHPLSPPLLPQFKREATEEVEAIIEVITEMKTTQVEATLLQVITSLPWSLCLVVKKCKGKTKFAISF